MRRNCKLALFPLPYLNLSPYSKLLAQYVCCRAVADTLPPCFTNKCKIEKSSIIVPVSDVFFLRNNLPDSLRKDKVGDIVSHFLPFLLKFGS